MGPQTQKALKDFQQQKGLDANGQLDQKTLSALVGGSAAARVRQVFVLVLLELFGSSMGSGGSSASGSTTEQKPQQAPAPTSPSTSEKKQ